MDIYGSFRIFSFKIGRMFSPQKVAEPPWFVVERNSPEPSRNSQFVIPRGLASAGGSQDLGVMVRCWEVKMARLDTPPKFNIAPEKWWLEDYFPIGKVTFQGPC